MHSTWAGFKDLAQVSPLLRKLPYFSSLTYLPLALSSDVSYTSVFPKHLRIPWYALNLHYTILFCFSLSSNKLCSLKSRTVYFWIHLFYHTVFHKVLSLNGAIFTKLGKLIFFSPLNMYWVLFIYQTPRQALLIQIWKGCPYNPVGR